MGRRCASNTWQSLQDPGNADTSHQLTIESETTKNNPTYYLTIKSADRYMAIDAPFMQWFTADGYFVAKPFQQWLASTVDIIGDSDPKSLADIPKIKVSQSKS